MWLLKNTTLPSRQPKCQPGKEKEGKQRATKCCRVCALSCHCAEPFLPSPALLGFGQGKAPSIHLSWSPCVGVSCKYECWRASSASTDTTLHVVSQNHNLLIPAVSWDEQKHAGVKLCKLTLLNYASVAACAREYSGHITHEGSCGESKLRRGWGSWSPWLQCGKSGRHHGKTFSEEQLPHWCSECRRKLTSGVWLLPYSWQPLKDTRSRISGWIGME